MTSDDSPPEDTGEPTPSRRPRSPWRAVLRAGQILLPILVLVGAAWGMRWMLQHRVRAKRRKPKPRAVLVEVAPVRLSQDRVVVKAMGRIKAAREVVLHPRVKGEIRALGKELVPGGRVARGAVLVRIDPDDYRIAVRQAQSSVKQAEADLKVEQGRQAIARQEFALVGKTAKGRNPDLMLRGPQLRKAQATLDAARAALRRAELDLRRTVIRAPINAVVLSRDAEVGTRVTESTPLTKLVGTDAYWVELVVPVDQLHWLRIPTAEGAPASRVRVRDPAAWTAGATRLGHILRMAPDLEEKGRMARLIVRVEDPLALTPANRGKPQLLLGSWVEAELAGSELTQVVVVPRRVLRGGEKLWIMDAKGRLDIRSVTVAHRGPDRVLVSKGLRAGERLVVSDIATPVQGMRLRVLRRSGSKGRRQKP